MLYCSNPDLSQLKVFGCACYPYLRPYNSHKLEPRTRECVFFGYSTVSKGYLCLDLSPNQVYTSRHVLFTESKLPYTLHTPTKSISSKFTYTSTNATWFSNLLYLHSTNHPSVLGPFPFAQSNKPSSFPTTPHIPLPTSPDLPSQLFLLQLFPIL